MVYLANQNSMSNTISSVTESLKLLQLVAQYPNRGLSELARLSGLNKSRTFRMLCTLVDQHFVLQNADGSYQLGHQLLILGQYARQQTNLIQAVEKVSETLSLRFNENLQLRILDHQQVVQIWRKTSTQALQVRSNVGNQRELGAGAAGKVLLAFATPDFQQHYLSQLAPPQAERLATLTTTIQRDGFYLSQGELTAGVYAVAVPIFNAEQRCIACFSLSVPEVRATETRLQEIIEAMQQASKHLSQLLGANYTSS